MLYSDQLFSEVLRDIPDGLPYHVSRRLADQFSDRAMVEGADYRFDVSQYANAGLCELIPAEDVYSQFTSGWSRHTGVQTSPANAWFEVMWQGHSLDVIVMNWGCENWQWIVADELHVAKSFFESVCGFTEKDDESVLLFDGGCWESSHLLRDAIAGTTFDNIVLESSLKHALMADLPRFFDAESTYKQHNVPWKRGLLLTGPPGNGKTHAIKALVNQSTKPCLYVKSFASDNRDVVESGNMRAVFERARQSAPCMLVLEDLDALINNENRSFFLNEMDGFASNEGVVTIASTNHPDRLDPAILNRPSRFDRKFVFELPAYPERREYLSRWNRTWSEALKLTEPGLDVAGQGTEGFSFATLKELMLSATMAWIELGEPGTMDGVLAGQVELMRSQNVQLAASVESQPE